MDARVKPAHDAKIAVGPPIYEMRPQDILAPVPAGLCCKGGNFHIDPVRPVERAVITHGHSDHARAGHGAVLATQETLDIMRLRYGENFAAARRPFAMARRSGSAMSPSNSIPPAMCSARRKLR